MRLLDRLPYREVWYADFEFAASSGERPSPICLVARELRTGRTIRAWQDELQRMPRPPYPIDAGALFIAFYASAELGCHLALSWPMPARILDLFTEFRAATNGLPTVAGSGLLGALAAYGLDAMGAEEKAEMRTLALRGGPYSAEEQRALLAYCEADVDGLARLLPAMLPGILGRVPDPTMALGQALLRGRYMAAAAQMEWAGVPIDVPMLARLRAGWDGIKERLVAEVDGRYGVYDGLSFRAERFAAWLAREGIPWPRLPSGALDLADDTFREMARAYPQVQTLRELRIALSQLRLNALAVGGDGRNRCLLSAFRARTSRNQPSNSKFIFGPSKWLRGLIRPPEGYALAYVDYSSQEVGIAAALSGDPALMAAYQAADVYLSFAKQAGLAPPDATKASHGAMRDRCKAVLLGVGYGMEADTMAARIGGPVAYARELLALHHRTYPRFWRWSDAVVDAAMLHNRLLTVFGWPVHVGPQANPRSLRNFPAQSHGAEMLRLACCLATEAGLEVCAPVHDALLLAATLDRLDEDVARLRACMAEASRIVLAGFEIKTDVKLIRWPDRYADERGAEMWRRVLRLLGEAEGAREAA
jgi:DNA polymerase-1